MEGAAPQQNCIFWGRKMMHLTESIDMKDGRASHNLTFLKDLSKPTCAQHKKEEVRRSFLDQMLVTHFWYLTLIFKWMKTCTCLCAKRQTFIFFCDLIFQDLDRLLIQFPLSCFRDFFYSQSMHTRTLFGNLFMCCITHERRARLQLHVWLPYCHTCYSCHIQLYVLQTF